MKRIQLILVLVAAFCVAAFATNASAGPVGTLEFNLGYMKSSNEMTTDGESLGGGIGLGASYWRSASPSVSWGAEVSYDNLGSVEATTGTVTEEVNAKAFRVTPALRMNFGNPVGPSFFAQGGAGLYSVSSEVNYTDSADPTSSFTADGSESKFGFNLGAGVGFPVGPKTKMNIQGQYHSVATEGESLNYLAFRAGIGIGL